MAEKKKRLSTTVGIAKGAKSKAKMKPKKKRRLSTTVSKVKRKK